jgi:hypothetical protein
MRNKCVYSANQDGVENLNIRSRFYAGQNRINRKIVRTVEITLTNSRLPTTMAAR